jgi:hypothetical protein
MHIAMNNGVITMSRVEKLIAISTVLADVVESCHPPITYPPSCTVSLSSVSPILLDL